MAASLYAQTLRLLEQRGVPTHLLGKNTVSYFLTVEKLTPEQVADLLAGRPVCATCAKES